MSAITLGRSPASGLKVGWTGTPMLAITVLVVVSTTDTVLSPELVTYTRRPSGVIARLNGVGPTFTVSTTAFVVVSTIVTELPSEFTTYARFGLATPGALPLTATPL